MDTWQTMSTMVRLFLDIVEKYEMVEMIEGDEEGSEKWPPLAELHRQIKSHLEQLQRFYRGGKHFDQIGYAGQIRQLVNEALEAENGEKALEHFLDYSEFITAIMDLKDLPGLRACFCKAELSEWVLLEVDLQTFGEFARGLIESVEEAFTRGEEVEDETVINTKMMAKLYKINLSPDFRAKLDFQLFCIAEDSGDENGANDQSSVYLQ